MTILFISHYSGFYGAAKSMLALILDLRTRYGVRPIVLLPCEGVLCEELEKNNIDYYVSHYYWWVNYNHGIFQKLLNLRKQIFNCCKILKLSKLIEAEDVDLVYSNSFTINVGLFIAEKLQVPHVWQFRESMSQFNLSLPLPLSLSLLYKDINKKYILISDYMVDYYSKYLPVNKIVKIYNGINVPLHVREENVISQGILNLCIVGILCEQKNQLDALNAISLLNKRGRSAVCLNLVGAYQEDYLKKLNQFIIHNSLCDQVRIWGHRSDIDTILDEMNVGLMCSRDEAFGRVTVEYMAHRMPVIASMSGANIELVEIGVDGYIYPIHDIEVLADLLEFYMDNPLCLSKMGNNAYDKVIRNFTVEKNTDAIYEQIKECMIN